jgi:hypothetical protein
LSNNDNISEWNRMGSIMIPPQPETFWYNFFLRF